MRFEEGGSQEQLVVELCEHFLKPLINAMSSNFSLSEHVLDADERADKDEDEDMNALFDGNRPLNDSREDDVIRRRMESTKVYVESIKKVEKTRRDFETSGGVEVADSDFYLWLQQQSKACCVHIYNVMSDPGSSRQLFIPEDIRKNEVFGVPDAKFRVNI